MLDHFTKRIRTLNGCYIIYNIIKYKWQIADGAETLTGSAYKGR